MYWTGINLVPAPHHVIRCEFGLITGLTVSKIDHTIPAMYNGMSLMAPWSLKRPVEKRYANG